MPTLDRAGDVFVLDLGTPRTGSTPTGSRRWAVAEGHAEAEPFTYAQARTLYGDQLRDRQINLAVRPRPKAHVTIKYLERDFEALVLKALAGYLARPLAVGGST